ncbi:MAG: methyltransferase domain-containing protein [Clostridiales bacterium]|nr:methyltransferase domain-containing protein [Clostridiales bacterium]
MGNIEKFDSIAEQYDTAERIMVADAISEHIRRSVGGFAGKRAIDYGCGTGLVGLRLLDVFRQILFIDASPKMVECVKRKIEDSHAQNADALQCDLLVENPSGLKTDYIIVAQVLLHIKDVELFLRRLRPVLNDGGHLLIVDFDKNNEVVSTEVHNGFDQQALGATVRRCGYTLIRSSTFYYGSKMFMNKDASLFMLDAEKQ